MSEPGSISAETVGFGGRRRTYRLFVPARVVAPAPLLVVLNGGGGAGMRAPGFDAIAGRLGFPVLYPDGTGRGDGALSWNDGRPGTYAYEQHIDDVGYIAELIDSIVRALPVDRRRVYVTGVSDGGMMAYRLACDVGEIIAAFAPVAATLTAPRIDPLRPRPLLHIHGTADPEVPLEASLEIQRSRGYRNSPVRDVVERWARICGCGVREQKRLSAGVEQTTWRGGPPGAEVTLITVANGGHVWPGGVLGRGAPVTAFAATPAIWAFFQRHILPES
jgi:polyhydroxybutyrate depolymerase